MGTHRHAGLSIVCLTLTACATVVAPPASPADPRTVYLLDHGRHSSLVLPAAAGDRLIRYEYGDWDWVALDRRGPVTLLGALFCPSQAGLGRRELSGPPESIGVPIENLHAIDVEAENVRLLRERLEAIHETHRGEAVDNPLYELEFVHHPTPYTIAHNSNRVVADWLEDLGCHIEGPGWRASWEVRTPD